MEDEEEGKVYLVERTFHILQCTIVCSQKPRKVVSLRCWCEEMKGIGRRRSSGKVTTIVFLLLYRVDASFSGMFFKEAFLAQDHSGGPVVKQTSGWTVSFPLTQYMM